MMQAWLAADGCESFLEAELGRAFPGCPVVVPAPGFRAVEGDVSPVPMAFAAQVLPGCERLPVPSIRSVAGLLVERLLALDDGSGGWRLDVAPCFGEGRAGEHRCALIEAAVLELLKKRHRGVARRRMEAGVVGGAPGTWIQMLLTSPEHALVSVLDRGTVHRWRSGLVPFPAGRIPVAVDKAAPSRAFAKLVESEFRLGAWIRSGETVVDLGACPGSWTHVAVGRGASVTSVDRTELRGDLMRNPRVRFVRGDAFSFEPGRPVDWLVCDVIAAPERSIGLAIDWARRRWARRLVVTIKFKGVEEYPKLDALKSDLAPLCREFRLARLCANKNEACVMAEPGPA